jgi:hypothetical protein
MSDIICSKDDAADKFLKTPTVGWSEVVFGKVPRQVMEGLLADRNGFRENAGMVVGERMANASDADLVHEMYRTA